MTDDKTTKRNRWTLTDKTTLLRLWQGGDESARDELFRRLARLARGRLRMRLPPVDIEDVQQALYERLLRALPTFCFDCSLKTFYALLERRTLATYYRDRYRGPVPFDPNSQTLEDIGQATASRVVSLNEHFRRLVESMDRLTVRQHEIFDLALLQQVPRKVVADELGISVQTVNETVHKCRMKLRYEAGEHYMQISKSDEDQLDALDLDLRRLNQMLGR